MKDIINETVPHCDILEANRKKGKMIKITNIVALLLLAVISH